MPPRKANLWDLVIVDWLDAYVKFDPLDVAQVADLPACIRRTVGYLVRDDKEYLAIAGTDDRKSAKAIEGYELQDLNMIPKGCVKNIIRLMGSGGSRESDLLS